MYVHESRNCGKVTVNKKSFHLIGFTSIDSVNKTVEKLKLLVSTLAS